MTPLRQDAARARRLAKAHPTEEHRATYRSLRNKYFREVEREKTNSWRRYLSTLTVDTLFQAKKHATTARTSNLVLTPINSRGEHCIAKNDKAIILFQATCVATSQCDLRDVDTSPFPRGPQANAMFFPTPSISLTLPHICDSLNSTHPIKAPGPDRIENWVWTLAWDVIQQHVTLLFQAIARQGYIPPSLENCAARTVMLAKPGKGDYTKPGAYRPITLINTIKKVFGKCIATYMLHIAESCNFLHPGHSVARPGRSSQEALIHLTSWIKAQWRAGRLVGAIFANVKSAFPSVHHPRMIEILQTVGYPPELVNIFQSFFTERKTYISFNSFDSANVPLDHGLPQGFPLSPLLYLLYNIGLLELADTHPQATSLGFVDYLVMLTAAANDHDLGNQTQALADSQID